MTFGIRWVFRLQPGRWWGVAMCLLIASAASAQGLSADATALRAKHDGLRASLASSPFQQPLLLQAAAGDDALKGEVYAVVDQPFGVTGPALQDRARWCDVLILHLNVKQCRVRGGSGSETMALVVGRKFEQPAGAGRSVDFGFRVLSAGPDSKIELRCRGVPLLTGRMGRVGSSVAVRVDDAVERTDASRAL